MYKLIDQRLPHPGTNGYTASDVVKALWAAVLTRKGRTVLAVIDELRTNDGVRAILGLRRRPSAAAVADAAQRCGGICRRAVGRVPAAPCAVLHARAE